MVLKQSIRLSIKKMVLLEANKYAKQENDIGHTSFPFISGIFQTIN